METFASAVGDDNPAYCGSDDIVAHPVFGVLPLRNLMPALLADPDLDCHVSQLVHGEQAYHYHRPLRPGDTIQLRGVVTGIEDKHSGQVLHVDQFLEVDGQVAVKGVSAAFVYGSGGLPPKRRTGPLKVPFWPLGVDVVYAETSEVDRDLTRRYAEASGDFNPIHLDAAVARQAGLPGVILHGTCSLAFAAKAIVRGALEGDPSRLQSLAVRFARPVVVPGAVTTSMWWAAPDAVHFEAQNQDGRTVLARGVAICRPLEPSGDEPEPQTSSSSS